MVGERKKKRGGGDTSDAKAIADHLSSSRPMPSQSLNSGCFGKSSRLFYVRAWCYMAWTIPLVTSGQLSWLCLLPGSCPSLADSLGWQSNKQRKTLTLCSELIWLKRSGDRFYMLFASCIPSCYGVVC